MLNSTLSKKGLPAHSSTSNMKVLQASINNFLENMENLSTSYLEQVGMAWWVEISTKNPDCIYYFGPFVSHREAQVSQLGYIEDLERERPQLIAIEIKQCQPEELTIFKDDWREKINSNISRSISA